MICIRMVNNRYIQTRINKERVKVNILVLNGTPRKHGRTRILAAFLAEKYKGTLIDLSQTPLPLYNGEEEQDTLSAVKQLKEEAAKADGILLCSPEYHSGMSGALKNALDYLNNEYFAGKPVAIFAVAGGGKGGINALNNMRMVARGLYSNVIPKQLVLDPDDFDMDQRKIKEGSQDKVDAVMQQFLIFKDLKI